jgi:hypothetical protein
VTNDTEQGCTCPSSWLETLLREAYPESAGVTLAAVTAMATAEKFGRAQVAYLISLAYAAGAGVRSAADAAELVASREVRFDPQPTREARVALRVRAMGEQHEIAWLRRTGEPPPEPWAGGTADEALEQFGWGE